MNASNLELGVHSYAISNLSNPTIPVLRGKAGSQGYAHDLIILAPNSEYREWILQLRTMRVAVTNYTTPDVGRSFRLPEFQFYPSTSPDSDGDGLHDLAEFILGTNPNNPDSDGDGVQDGVEIQDGTDPLDGLPASIGIIAATDTPGTAVDVCAINDLAVVANREAGVSVLNVAGQNPIRIAEVDTPGQAWRVACSGNLVAVADGEAGLAIIDITDPPAARILHQVNLSSPVQAVTAAGGLAYVGLADGQLATVDLASGFVLSRRQLGGSVQDVVFSGDHLLALTAGALLVLNPYDLELPKLGSVGANGTRLVAGNGWVYVTVSDGFDVFSIGRDAVPALVRQERPGQNSWLHIVPNGSGLGIAVTRASFIGGSHEVDVYGLPAPDQAPQFITQIATPGDTQSVSIYNGRAYAADGLSGLQVINYLAFDAGKTPPTITLSSSFPVTTSTDGVAEEGKFVRVAANVTDDVQVRNVEFYLDGAKVLTDGNFPFEHRFVTPRINSAKTNFTVRAKATDTGGNVAWSDEVRVALTRDTTPPRLQRIEPQDLMVVTNANAIFAFFNELMDVNSLTPERFFLTWAGPDYQLGTSDDQTLTNAIIGYREILNVGVVSFPEPLPNGVYRMTVTTGVTDAAGNGLVTGVQTRFAILESGPSGDDDGDDVTNAEELALGLNPRMSDTDGDGWIDRVELDDGTDPLHADSKPQQTHFARPPVELLQPSPDTAGTAGVPAYVARPPVLLGIPSADAYGSGGVAIWIARPPVSIDRPSADSIGSSGATAVFAHPPVSVILPSADMTGANGVPVWMARPPVLIDLPSQNSTSSTRNIPASGPLSNRFPSQ